MASEPTAGAVPEFDPDRTALVLVEFQRQWIDPGLYNLLVRRSLAKHDVVERTRDTVRAARNAGVLVVHAPLVIDLENKRGWLATLTRGLVFTESTPRVAFTPGLYCEGDPVVEGRYTLDAFEGSDLRTILWANGVETVFFA
jgi:nicotinamidase-related amidase